MQITKFSPIPDFLLDRFVKFESSHNGKSWEELYIAISHLKAQYPDKQFRDEPYLYVDLTNQTSGFLFIDGESDELYYVHQ